MEQVNVRQYIQDLRKKRDSLTDKFRALESELAEIDRKLARAEAFEEDYYREYDLSLPSRPMDPVLQRKFGNLSIKEMLIVLANEAGGTLDLTQARRTLLKAGVFRDERNAVTSMSSVLSKHDDIFKRSSRATYELDHSKLSDKERSILTGAQRTAEPKVTVHVLSEDIQTANSLGDEDIHVVLALRQLQEFEESSGAERLQLMNRLGQIPKDVMHKAMSLYMKKYGKAVRIEP